MLSFRGTPTRKGKDDASTTITASTAAVTTATESAPTTGITQSSSATTPTKSMSSSSLLRNTITGGYNNGISYRDMKKLITYAKQQNPNDPESFLKQMMTTGMNGDGPSNNIIENGHHHHHEGVELRDEDHSNEIAVSTIQEQLIQQEQTILSLHDMNRKLQAQNILVSVQQLDMMTRIVATISYLVLWYYIYWRCIIQIVLIQYVVPFLLQQQPLQVVLQEFGNTILKGFGNSIYCATTVWYNSIVTQEGMATTLLFLLWEVPSYILQQAYTVVLQSLWNPIMVPILLHPTTLYLLSFIVFGITVPYIHHRNTHGLLYRRCDVFAVFFVFVIRMKLCRWRESIFVTKKIKENDHDNDNDMKVVLNDVDMNGNNNATDPAIVTSSITPIPTYGTNIGEDDIWDANYEISARYLYVSILRLQGLWTKSAQYISSRADFMPTPYVRELQQLQDSTPPTPYNIVRKMIPPHIHHALINIDPIPLASASIGQVHTATLRKTGEKVVLKVQHPQARTLLTDDFRSLHIFCRIIESIEPDYGFIGILMREWAIEAKKELDFVQEMNNLKDATKSIESMTSNANQCLYTNATDTIASVPFQIEIPRPYETLCNRNVLVMSFCEGKRIDDMTQMKLWNLNPVCVMDGVAQVFAHMMYVTSPFNGDPHAGNLLVRPGCVARKAHHQNDGFTIVLLDWGLAKHLSDTKRKAFCQMVYAAATFDYGLMLDAFTTIGLKLKRENVNEDMEGIRFMLREIVPPDVSRKRIKAKFRTDTNRMNARDKKDKVPMESKAYPGEFFFFVRVNELLHGLGSKFGIHLNYVDILKPYAERGLSLLSPYSEHGSTVQRVSPTISKNNRTDSVLQAKLTDVLQKLQHQGHIAGAQVCVLNADGAPLANVVMGHCGGLKKRIAMQSDTLVLGFSCTKAVAATLAHRMVQLGYLTYDECVCDSAWPAFCPTTAPPPTLYEALNLSAANAKERWMWKRQITMRHILTHRAGMWSALPAQLTIQHLASCEQCVKSFEYDSLAPENTLLPDSCPGSKTEYHYISFGWLVAGTLMGAFARKHNLNRDSVTFEQVYETILRPLLSQATLTSGFLPCGCGVKGASDTENVPTAYVETEDISISKILQLQREAEAYGEKVGNQSDAAPSMQNPQSLVKGKEFLLDQRIWNCEIGLRANCPAAGGRFSACGLAYFYHDLGTKRTILDEKTFMEATAQVISIANTLSAENSSSLSFAFQGPTNMSSNKNNNDGSVIPTTAADEASRRALGFGYQLISFESDPIDTPSAFGHAGIGGSIGLFHKSSQISIGIMLNKIDADKSTTPTILRTIQQHLKL